MKNSESPLTAALHERMNRELLKHAAGTYIFCPNCERVLDWKTVIIIDVIRDQTTIGHAVYCTHCVQSLDQIEEVAKAKGVQVEITKYEE